MKTIHRHLIRAALLSLAAFVGGPSYAELVTSIPVGIAATTITFSPYDLQTSPVVFNGPVDVGAAEGKPSAKLSFEEVDPKFPQPHILGAVELELGVVNNTNGHWPTSGAYAGLNGNFGSMTFIFSGGVNFVGGFMNYNRSTDATVLVEALDEFFQPIAGESVDLTDSLNILDDFGPGNGLFLGFKLDSADIWGLRLSSGNVVIDNLTFGTFGQVPEPGALVLVLAALAGLGWQQQRRAARSR